MTFGPLFFFQQQTTIYPGLMPTGVAKLPTVPTGPISHHSPSMTTPAAAISRTLILEGRNHLIPTISTLVGGHVVGGKMSTNN